MATHTATAALQRRSLGVFTTTVVVLGIGYIASILLARFLGADGRGLVAVIQTGAAALAGIGGIGTQHAATYYASRRPRRRAAVLGNGLAHAGILLVVSVAIALVVMGRLQEHLAATAVPVSSPKGAGPAGSSPKGAPPPEEKKGTG
jgi:O-antigen/teichoic acid export membrane protein